MGRRKSSPEASWRRSIVDWTTEHPMAAHMSAVQLVTKGSTAALLSKGIAGPIGRDTASLWVGEFLDRCQDEVEASDGSGPMTFYLVVVNDRRRVLERSGPYVAARIDTDIAGALSTELDPTPRGHTNQMMRHNEAVLKIGFGALPHMLETMGRLLDRAEARAERAEARVDENTARVFEVLKLREDLLDRSAERARADATARMKDGMVEEAGRQVMPLLKPMLSHLGMHALGIPAKALGGAIGGAPSANLPGPPPAPAAAAPGPPAPHPPHAPPDNVRPIRPAPPPDLVDQLNEPTGGSAVVAAGDELFASFTEEQWSVVDEHLPAPFGRWLGQSLYLRTFASLPEETQTAVGTALFPTMSQEQMVLFNSFQQALGAEIERREALGRNAPND